MRLLPFRKLKRRKGQTTVEFAMCLIVFFILFFSIIDLARYYAVEQALTHGAQYAGRLASTGSIIDGQTRADSIKRYVRKGALGGLVLSMDDSAITITPTDGGNGSDEREVTINIVREVLFITPFMGFLTDGDQSGRKGFPIEVEFTYFNERFNEDNVKVYPADF